MRVKYAISGQLTITVFNKTAWDAQDPEERIDEVFATLVQTLEQGGWQVEPTLGLREVG